MHEFTNDACGIAHRFSLLSPSLLVQRRKTLWGTESPTKKSAGRRPDIHSRNRDIVDQALNHDVLPSSATLASLPSFVDPARTTKTWWPDSLLNRLI